MSAAIAPVLTQKQVGELLNISRTTLWRLRRGGKLRAYQLSPRRVGYSLEHVQELLQNSEEGNTNERD